MLIYRINKNNSKKEGNNMMQSNEIKNENKAIVPKYKLGEAKTFNVRTLFRVEALRSFGNVSTGDIGGWIENEDNLSHSGDAWVYDEAMVYGNARVSNDAIVRDNACIYGNTKVGDEAQVFGNAIVYGNACISDNAQVYGNARISDDAQVYDTAHVFDNAYIIDNAWIGNNARVCGNARITDDSRVYDNALISGHSLISDRALIYGNAQVFDNGLVKGNTHVWGNAEVTKAVITIHTDAYNITITDNYITIGFENHPIADWETFTDDEISKMDAGALDWWRVWKPIIFAIINAY
jgi:carbonic anhydrase/acetyltransferase-like protein (isoleucine patch superfamily)